VWPRFLERFQGCVILLFRVVGESKHLSTVAPEDGIPGKPIFYSAKDVHLLSATTVEDETFSVWIELHSFWSFLLRWLLVHLRRNFSQRAAKHNVKLVRLDLTLMVEP
jgi:hypothetical protein